jgi:hypothetical protein
MGIARRDGESDARSSLRCKLRVARSQFPRSRFGVQMPRSTATPHDSLALGAMRLPPRIGRVGSIDACAMRPRSRTSRLRRHELFAQRGDWELSELGVASATAI